MFLENMWLKSTKFFEFSCKTILLREYVVENNFEKNEFLKIKVQT